MLLIIRPLRDNRVPGRDGFTLVEVVTAAAILILGMVFVSGTLVRTMEQRSALNTRQAARLLAASKMEEAFAGAPRGEGYCPVDENIYWRRTMRESSVSGMLEVEVAVFWNERGGGRNYVLKSLLRRR